MLFLVIEMIPAMVSMNDMNDMNDKDDLLKSDDIEKIPEVFNAGIILINLRPSWRNSKEETTVEFIRNSIDEAYNLHKNKRRLYQKNERSF